MEGKTALILHGWPRPVEEKDEILKILRRHGYKVICPKLFEREEFGVKSVKKWVKKALGQHKPELIVGISIGGLMLPYVANDYPDARLVFVSSGGRFNPKNPVVKYFLKRLGSGWGQSFFKIFKMIPKNTLLQLSRVVMPRGKANILPEDYELNISKNLEAVLRVKPNTMKSVADFIKKVNNYEILRGISNKTLVISGREDIVMPVKEGMRIGEVMPRARFVAVRGTHFSVMQKENLIYLEEFIEAN